MRPLGKHQWSVDHCGPAWPLTKAHINCFLLTPPYEADDDGN